MRRLDSNPGGNKHIKELLAVSGKRGSDVIAEHRRSRKGSPATVKKRGAPEVSVTEFFHAHGYDPLESQAKFHASEARFKGFSGPVGSGKSRALCYEALRLSLANAARMGLIGAPTYPMLRESTQAALFDVLEENEVPYDYNKGENALTFRENGSRIIFRPVDDYERLRGTNLAWFGLDELTYAPHEAWLRLEARLRDPLAEKLCGFGVWTPKGYDWVYRKFVADPVPGYDTVIARPRENRFLLSQVPDYYDRLQSSYDESLYQQEVLGQYLNMQGGLVYCAFSRPENVRALKMNPRSPLLWALDFNVDPMSSVVVQLDSQGIYVLDEISIRHASTQAACEEFYKRFGGHRGELCIYGDASGNSQQTTGSSDYQIIREFFQTRRTWNILYKVPKANPSVRDRVMTVNTKLRSAVGRVALFVDPKCRELIKDFEQVSYKEDSNVIDKDKDRRRTHLSDALGYLVWQECRPQATIGERPERLI